MFYFSDFLSNLLFFHFENRDRTEGKGQIELWVKSRKTKSRSTGIVKSWYFCLCLLCSIFDWIVSVKPVGMKQRKETLPLCPFTLRSYFIQKPFTQTTLFLHVYAIYFNHSKQQELLPQKRLQDFFHNTRAGKILSALLPFNNTFFQKKHITWREVFFLWY